MPWWGEGRNSKGVERNQVDIWITSTGPRAGVDHTTTSRLMSFKSHQLLIRAALRFTVHRRVLSTTSATGRGQCPKCHSALPTPLPACPKCSFISKLPSNIRYHEMFGLPSTDNPFKVDDKQLTRRFRKLQQTVHPDAWAAKGKVGVCRNQS